MEKMRIGITVGDINGVGLEVILKTLSHPKILDMCTPVVYGSTKVVSYHKNIVDLNFQFSQSRTVEKVEEGRINIINCWQENVNITLGKPTAEGGRYAMKSLETATSDLKHGLIDALVTAPIHKAAMKMAEYPYPGHTEYLTHELAPGRESLMFMIHDQLRIGLVTNHHPLREVAGKINEELVLRKILIMEESLRVDFGIERPTVGVLGLNPHAGDDGVIGDEEAHYIRPAILKAKDRGLLVMGPYPADGFFGSGQYAKCDGILAMYHDQGLAPFKLLAFGEGVNFTAGLDGVRTSPDHGTAFDIVGKNVANPASFRKALYLAIDLARNRKAYHADRENALSSNRFQRANGKVRSEEEE